MRRSERKVLKCNARLVEIVFSLMFETFWAPPYDWRRTYPLLINFERRARNASLLLGKVNFRTASGAQLCEVEKAVCELERSVREIADARLFAPVECAEALEQIGRIRDALPAGCAAGIPNR